MPPGTTLDYEKARVSATANPDGFGFAIHAGNTIIKDHDMDFEKLWKRWSDLRSTYVGASMFHFRISTHGTTNIDNCHPFDIGDSNDTVIGHNGILPITMPIGDARSDTRMFAEIVLPHIGGAKALDNKEIFKNIEDWAIGSKMVVLSASKETIYDWYILNEHQGHWHEDMWWSNSSYKRLYPTTYVNYGYGGTYVGAKNYSKTIDNTMYGDDWDDYGHVMSPADKKSLEYVELYDYLSDELYADSGILATVNSFTDYSHVDTAHATCHGCGVVYYVDPFEITATHCGECKGCMACGSKQCDCWEHFEYGQSFFVDMASFKLDGKDL